MTRSLDRLVHQLHILLLLVGAIGVVVGGYFVLGDLASHDDFLDGLGVALGLVMIVGSALPAAASVMAIRSTVRGQASRRWSVVAGALGTLTLVLLGLLIPPLLVVALLPLALVVAASSARPVEA